MDTMTINDLQNTTQKIYDRVTRTPLKIGGELRCSGRVRRSCSTSGTRRVTLHTNPVISHEWGKDREVLTTSGTYLRNYNFNILLVQMYINCLVFQYFCLWGYLMSFIPETRLLNVPLVVVACIISCVLPYFIWPISYPLHHSIHSPYVSLSCVWE